MAKKDLTNQRQVFVEEYVRSGDHLEAAKTECGNFSWRVLTVKN